MHGQQNIKKKNNIVRITSQGVSLGSWRHWPSSAADLHALCPYQHDKKQLQAGERGKHLTYLKVKYKYISK